MNVLNPTFATQVLTLHVFVQLFENEICWLLQYSLCFQFKTYYSMHYSIG